MDHDNGRVRLMPSGAGNVGIGPFARTNSQSVEIRSFLETVETFSNDEDIDLIASQLVHPNTKPSIENVQGLGKK